MAFMRVAITGGHGVGKSKVLGVPVLSTPGRTLAGRGLPVNEDATIISQSVAWLLQYRFEREQTAWVAPRSLIDVWAYTRSRRLGVGRRRPWKQRCLRSSSAALLSQWPSATTT
jgi:hypothetical protein